MIATESGSVRGNFYLGTSVFLCDLAPVNGASDLGRSGTHALREPAPSKPLETTGEYGASAASVRRVAARTDLSIARS